MNEVNELDLIIRLKKPYTFEGKEYTEVDISKLDEWTAADVDKARRTFEKMQGVDAQAAAAPEVDSRYCRLVASMASDLPLEFFNEMPARDCRMIDAAVSGFFLA